NILTAGYYDVYQWHPQVTNASATVPFIINYNGDSTTIFANQQTNAGNWTLLGRFNFAAGTTGNVRVSDAIAESTTVAIADGVKLVYALPTTRVVVNLNDSGAGSLRDAIAASSAGDIVTFSNGLAGTITLTSGTLLIDRDLTILGPGAKIITLSGNNAFEVFQITSGAVNISGLSITRAASTAIDNQSGTLLLSNCNLASNSTPSSVSGG